MWHHRAVEHIRRSVKQRVDLVTVLKNYNSDRIFITTWETKEAFCNSWWWCNLVPFFFWVESNWFNSHHSYSSFYTSVALLTDVSRFCFCVRKAHRGEVRFWKRSWSWWAWTSQQQDCMYFFTWGANAEWKDPLLGNIISLGKKTHVSDIFVYLWSPFLFRLASISPFSLSLRTDFFPKKKTVHPKRCSLGFLRCLWRTFCLAPISGKSNGGSNSRISAEVGGTTTGCPPEVTHSKFTTIGPN